MTAERENVYKSRPAVSLERAQEVAQKFMEDVRSKRNLREKRLEMIQKQKEDKDTGKADWWIHIHNDEWQMCVCCFWAIQMDTYHTHGRMLDTWRNITSCFCSKRYLCGAFQRLAMNKHCEPTGDVNMSAGFNMFHHDSNRFLFCYDPCCHLLFTPLNKGMMLPIYSHLHVFLFKCYYIIIEINMNWGHPQIEYGWLCE